MTTRIYFRACKGDCGERWPIDDFIHRSICKHCLPDYVPTVSDRARLAMRQRQRPPDTVVERQHRVDGQSTMEQELTAFLSGEVSPKPLEPALLFERAHRMISPDTPTRRCHSRWCNRALPLDQFATPRMRICKACYGRMTVERIHEASEVRRDKWNAYQREYARKRRRSSHAPDPQI